MIVLLADSYKGSFSPPVITRISINTYEVVLECESEGWYLETEMQWLDGEGKLLSAGPTERDKGADGLYTVSRRVTVEKSNDDILTCRVHQQNIKQTRETQLKISAPESLTILSILIGCCGGLAGGLVGGMLLLGGVWYFFNKSKSGIVPCCSKNQTETSHAKVSQLQKHSQKIQEELNVWNKDLFKLKEQKSGLQKLNSKLRLQLQRIEKEREKNNERINEVVRKTESERDNDTERTEGYLREKQSLLDAQGELQKRKVELEDQQLSIESLLESAEGIVASITQSCTNKENELKMIDMQLEEEMDGMGENSHLHIA
ncbi:butyrophilin subfamily 1 member A1-like [Notolabrus celidotus]|uniref:butyrophilin subfamily 1 member A1-like n=1 Tax=Notolabrus celidotus TaxID=1203425 RepID=UPI00149035ED|nr:butyrophilin subfamily 1 member A1-like [Notolabrus celidotus]